MMMVMDYVLSVIIDAKHVKERKIIVLSVMD